MSEGHFAPLAPWAVSTSRGREYAEGAEALRGAFAVDRHRIIHSTAFRRLDGKTQVFAPEFHDHFRNRLEHTIEVANIARTLARALGANEELAEAITLGHDLGHPPFGHAGEAALDEAMAGHGGFNHNAHSLRVVEYLEHPYPGFRGLNLTRETRHGVRLHETKFDRPAEQPNRDSLGESPTGFKSLPFAGGSGVGGAVPAQPRSAAANHDSGARFPDRAVQLGPSVETQIASLADRVAYDGHDLEDAIGAGFVTRDELRQLALWEEACGQQPLEPRGLPVHAVRRAVLDAMLSAVLLDAVETSHSRLAPVRSADEAATAREPLVCLSDGMESHLCELEKCLVQHVYRRPEIAAADERGKKMIRELFAAYRRLPRELPARFLERVEEQGLEPVVCDYIAGMTDRFCTRDHARLTS